MLKSTPQAAAATAAISTEKANNEPFGEVVQERDDEEMQELQETRRTRSKREDEEAEIQRYLKKELPLKFVLETVETSNLGLQLSRDLVIYVGFIIAFLFFGYFQRNTLQEFYLAESVRQVIINGQTPPTLYNTGAIKDSGPHWIKTLMNLHSADEWHDWFEGVVIPAFYDPLNRDTPRSRMSPFGGTSLAIGLLRLRRLNVHNRSCSVKTEYFNATGGVVPCFAQWDSSYRDTAPFVDPNTGIVTPFQDSCHYSTLQDLLGREATYPCGGHIVDFSLTWTFNQALTRARQLRAAQFVTLAATRLVSVEFFAYNPAFDLFVGVKAFNEITKGGGMLSGTRVKAFKVFTESGFGIGFIIYSFFFFAAVVAYFARFLLGWYWHATKSGKWIGFIFDLWNAFELVNLGIFFTAFGFFWRWWVETPFALKTTIFPMDGTWPDGLALSMELWYTVNYLNCINSVITFLQLLKYFRMNNRLNILTRTIEAAAQSIIGVLVIFALIVLAYALCGNNFYGAAIEDYRSVEAAWTTLFLTLMGKFDYNALREENKGITFIYFWSFIILGLFVLLNFIIAILGNAFDAEQERTTSSIPLSKTIKRITRRFRKQHMKDALTRYYEAAVLRTKRLREDIVADFLGAYRRTLLAGDNLNEAVVMSGVEDEPLYMLSRARLNELIPSCDMPHVTTTFLDELWVEACEDYEATLENDDAEEERQTSEILATGMAQGFVKVFLEQRRVISRAQQVILSGDIAAAASAADALQAQAAASALRRGSRGSLRRGSTSSAGSEVGEGEASGEGERKASSPSTETPSDAQALAMLAGCNEDDTAPAEVRRREVLSVLCNPPPPSPAPGLQDLARRLTQLEQALVGTRTVVTVTSHKVAAVVARLDSKSQQQRK